MKNPIKELSNEVGSTTDIKSIKKGAGKPNRIRAEPRKMLPLIIVPRKQIPVILSGELKFEPLYIPYTIMEVIILSIMLGSCPPGKVVVKAHKTPAAIPVIKVILKFFVKIPFEGLAFFISAIIEILLFLILFTI